MRRSSFTSGARVILSVVLLSAAVPGVGTLTAQQDSLTFSRPSFLRNIDAGIDRVIGRFRQDAHQESTGLGTVDSRWRSLGYVPFARAYGESVYPNTVPRPGERGRPLEAFAAPGESEPLVLGIRALDAGVRNLRIFCGGLVAVDTLGFIPPDSVQIGIVEFWRIRWGEGSDSRRWRWHPTRIWPAGAYPGSPFSRPAGSGAINIEPSTAQHFWITIHVPADAPPGNYSGTLFLESAVRDFRLPVFLRVLPVPLVERGLPPHGVIIPGPLDVFACRDLAEHRINSVASWYDPRYMPAEARNKGVDFDFRIADSFAARLGEAGLDRVHVLFAGDIAGARFDSAVAAVSGTEIDSTRFELYYAQAVQAIVEHSRKTGWPRLVWGVDHSLGGGAARRFERRAEALRRVMGRGLSLVSPIIGENPDGGVDELAPLVDVWLASEEAGISGAMREAAVWGYYPCTQRYSALQARRVTGFDTWLRRLDGFFLWAYNWPGGGHTWNDFDSGRMDWMLSYRDINDRHLPTPAWEGVREGIEDRLYVLTLENLLAAYPAGYANAVEARDFLGRLPRLMERLEDLERELAEMADPPPSNDESAAGTARRLIAGHIERIVYGYTEPADSSVKQ